MCEEVDGRTVQIKGYPMYYERRGTGNHFLLLIPGALGTGKMHFSYQHSGFNLEKFTLISVDLVGWGKSRPATRPTQRHYWFDAECCHLLMKSLDVDRYSILGFSDGGRVGLVMGSEYPDEIQKIVSTGSSCYITPAEKDALNIIRSTKSWSEVSLKEMRKVYSEEELERLWTQFLDAYFTYTDIFKSALSKIKCPVYILHGENDSVVFVEHAHYFKSHLSNAQLYVHSKGPHYFHMSSPSLFNTMVQLFLLE